MAPPYRLPVWRALGERCHLDVFLLEPPELGGVHAEGRSQDWQATSGETYSVRHLRTHRIARGAEHHYTLLESGLLRGYDAVLLGGWDSPAYWQLLTEARLMRKRVVGFYESHGGSSRFSTGPIATARSRFFRSLDAVVVPGPAAGAAIASFGVPGHDIVEGFNAVDIESFRPDAAAPEPPRGSFLYVGQLIPRKCPDTLLRAVATLPPEVRLTLVGEGEMEGELRDLAASLGVTDRVDFAGYVPYAELPGVMHRHAHLVLPSYEEVWGLVVNEALAAGEHVVVSEKCGVAQSVRGMSGVFLCSPHESSIAAACRASYEAWHGRIAEPEIIAKTPEAFAEAFATALGL